MIVDITAWAPTREIGVAFMAATGIAETAPETGEILALTQVDIHPRRPGETITVERVKSVVDEDGTIITPAEHVPGWHCNVRYWGDAAKALTIDGATGDVFERTRILDYVDQRTGEPMQWVALSDDSVPPGYQNADGVRLFDPGLIASRSSVWA